MPHPLAAAPAGSMAAVLRQGGTAGPQRQPRHWPGTPNHGTVARRWARVRAKQSAAVPGNPPAPRPPPRDEILARRTFQAAPQAVRQEPVCRHLPAQAPREACSPRPAARSPRPPVRRRGRHEIAPVRRRAGKRRPAEQARPRLADPLPQARSRRLLPAPSADPRAGPQAPPSAGREAKMQRQVELAEARRQRPAQEVHIRKHPETVPVRRGGRLGERSLSQQYGPRLQPPWTCHGASGRIGRWGICRSSFRLYRRMLGCRHSTDLILCQI